MTAKSRPDLVTQAQTDINDNTEGEISAADSRNLFIDSADSAFNLVTDTITQVPGAGSAASASTSDFATAAQGLLADSAVQSVVAGTNISVDNTDPRNPVVSASGGGGGGTVTSISQGTGITITPNPLVATGAVALADTAVVPGTYGSTTAVAAFTVDQQGRITAAADATISVTAIGGVPNTRQVIAGSGLTGGGALSSNVTLNANVGTGAGTVAAGDDSRFDWVTPQMFGAVADYDPVGLTGTDNTTAFQDAIDFAIANGRNVYVPSGDYLIAGAGLSINLSSLTVFTESGRFRFHGAGSASTRIYGLVTAAAVAITISGGAFGTGGQWSRWGMGGFMLLGQDPLPATNRTGIFTNKAIHCGFFDLEITGFNQAHIMRDVVGCRLDRYRLTFNNYGLLCDGTYTDSPVNELTFVGCHFISNRQYSGWFNESANIAFIGGSLEFNANAGAWAADLNQWGFRFTNAGKHGVTACTFNGFHIESNGGDYDIWIEHNAWPTTYVFNGTDFIRNGTTNFTTNNILFETTGTTQAHVLLSGCGFHAVNGYVADAGRRRIAFGTVTGNNHKITTIGCRGLEETLADAPTMLGGDGNAFFANAQCQTFRVAFTDTSALRAELANDTASVGPYITARRFSASPALSDLLGGLVATGNDSNGAEVIYGDIVASILDPTASSHDGCWNIRAAINGTLATGAQIGPGIAVGSSLPGVGRINVLTEYQVATNRVVNGRKTGWAVATGTATRTTFATHAAQTIGNPPTQAQVQNIDNSLVAVSQRVKALIDDLHATAGHGLIGT